MSLSNPRKKNPATKFIDWSGSKGHFQYYDKEKEENVIFEKPIYVVILDELSTIKGFHSASQSAVYSNEIRYLSQEILNVRSFKGGDIIKGIHSKIKGNLQGGKFAKSIYAALITGNKKSYELELVNISFVGSSLSSWIDAKIKNDDGKVIILNSSKKELINGNTIYFAPEITKSKKRDDILQKCIELDEILQEYLNTYLQKNQSDEIIQKESTKEIPQINKNTDGFDVSDIDVSDIDDLPF